MDHKVPELVPTFVMLAKPTVGIFYWQVFDPLVIAAEAPPEGSAVFAKAPGLAPEQIVVGLAIPPIVPPTSVVVTSTKSSAPCDPPTPSKNLYSTVEVAPNTPVQILV